MGKQIKSLVTPETFPEVVLRCAVSVHDAGIEFIAILKENFAPNDSHADRNGKTV